MRREFGAAMMVFGVLAIVALAVFYIIIPNLPQFNTELRIGDGDFSDLVKNAFFYIEYDGISQKKSSNFEKETDIFFYRDTTNKLIQEVPAKPSYVLDYSGINNTYDVLLKSFKDLQQSIKKGSFVDDNDIEKPKTITVFHVFDLYFKIL